MVPSTGSAGAPGASPLHRLHAGQPNNQPATHSLPTHTGMWIEWMRYAGWILTCPVLLMTLVSMPTLAPALALAWP